MPTPEEILKKYWGYDHFRPLQREIITSILKGENSVAILPTGGGKSICYQVPALYQPGLCLVISPLVSLMKDQVEQLKLLNISSEYIHSGLRYTEVKRLLNNALHDAYKLLYISPERLQSRLFEEYLPNLNINLIAVDEAHCISQWGHDFRPDYLKIADLKEAFPKTPLLALTASATLEVKEDMIAQLGLKSPKVFQKSIERANIQYDIAYTEQKNNDVLELINAHSGSKIIYCRSRKNTEYVHRLLKQNQVSSTIYHAGLSKEAKEKAQEDWLNDKTPAIIATTAFGMGIDKPDVRLVVHYDIPEHLEAYYQESGRAGRDGQKSYSVVLYNQIDIDRLTNSTDLQYPPVAYLRQVYQSVVEYLQIPIGAEPNQYFDFDIADFCEKFKLKALPAIQAIKLLEQEGLWTLSDSAYMPSTLHMLANRSELDALAQHYPDLSYVTTGLLRLYGTLFLHPTPIRIGAIAKQLRLRYNEVEQYLQQLHKMEYCIYAPAKDQPQLHFHHLRVDSKHLYIDTKRIKTLKDRHIQRTNAIIDYVTQHKQCRQQILNQYFGEEKGEHCGHCDVCLAQQSTERSDEKTLRKEIIALLQQSTPITVKEMEQNLPKAIKEDLITLIRTMADEQLVTIHANNTISLA